MKHLLCQAILEAGGMPRPGDCGHVLARAYHRAPDELHEGLVEEYYLKAIWGRDEEVGYTSTEISAFRDKGIV